MVVVEDSVGYVAAFTRVFNKIGITTLDTLEEWAAWKDRDTKRTRKYRSKKEVKLQRVEKRRADMNEGFKTAKKSKNSGGADYSSGIGINNASVSIAPVLPSTPVTATAITLTRCQQPRKRKIKPCTCGNEPIHYNSRHANRKCNKKNIAAANAMITSHNDAVCGAIGSNGNPNTN